MTENRTKWTKPQIIRLDLYNGIDTPGRYIWETAAFMVTMMVHVYQDFTVEVARMETDVYVLTVTGNAAFS